MIGAKNGMGFGQNYSKIIISEGDEAIPPSRFYLHKRLPQCMSAVEEVAKYLRELKQGDVFKKFGDGCCFVTGFVWADLIHQEDWQKNLDLYSWSFGDEWEHDPSIIPWNVHEKDKFPGGRDFYASQATNIANPSYDK